MAKCWFQHQIDLGKKELAVTGECDHRTKYAGASQEPDPRQREGCWILKCCVCGKWSYSVGFSYDSDGEWHV